MTEWHAEAVLAAANEWVWLPEGARVGFRRHGEQRSLRLELA